MTKAESRKYLAIHGPWDLLDDLEGELAQLTPALKGILSPAPTSLDAVTLEVKVLVTPSGHCR
jgi:hypothetical protein